SNMSQRGNVDQGTAGRIGERTTEDAGEFCAFADSDAEEPTCHAWSTIVVDLQHAILLIAWHRPTRIRTALRASGLRQSRGVQDGDGCAAARCVVGIGSVIKSKG